MKKSLAGIVFLLLSACTPMVQRQESEESDRYITNRRGYLLADICDPANAPRIPRRPAKLTSKDLKPLNEKEMDVRIKQYIRELDEYADKLEDAAVRIRRLSDICR